MRPHLIALICLSAILGQLASADSDFSAWRRYKRQHGKVYGPEEDARRFATFLATKARVERHNADPNATYKMALNRMSDWTADESGKLNGPSFGNAHQRLRRPVDTYTGFELNKLLGGSLLNEVDWRKVPNRVSPVKDQGDCDASWAFVAAGLLEGQQVARNITSKLVPLSAQELVDCSFFGSDCGGGSVVDGLIGIGFLHGIESEADYKYTGRKDRCKMEKLKTVMTIEGAAIATGAQERTLLRAVAKYGPIAVSVSVNEAFRSYQSGIFNGCTGHGNYKDVLLVGSGTDEKDGDYWIIKNSWGTKWGEEGYMRLKRGVNMCDILYYPTIALF